MLAVTHSSREGGILPAGLIIWNLGLISTRFARIASERLVRVYRNKHLTYPRQLHRAFIAQVRANSDAGGPPTDVEDLFSYFPKKSSWKR